MYKRQLSFDPTLRPTSEEAKKQFAAIFSSTPAVSSDVSTVDEKKEDPSEVKGFMVTSPEKSFEVHCSLKATVKDLKGKIDEKMEKDGLQKTSYKLTCSGREMREDEILGEISLLIDPQFADFKIHLVPTVKTKI